MKPQGVADRSETRMNTGPGINIIITPYEWPLTTERSRFELPLSDRLLEGPPGFACEGQRLRNWEA